MKERGNKVIKIALILFGIGAIYTVFVLVTGLGVPCPIHAVTGLLCPGCGISRMFVSLFRLDFKSAFSYNAAVLCLLPLMIAVAARYVFVYIKYGKRKDRFADSAVYFMIAALLVFGIVRNVI